MKSQTHLAIQRNGGIFLRHIICHRCFHLCIYICQTLVLHIPDNGIGSFYLAPGFHLFQQFHLFSLFHFPENRAFNAALQTNLGLFCDFIGLLRSPLRIYLQMPVKYLIGIIGKQLHIICRHIKGSLRLHTGNIVQSMLSRLITVPGISKKGCHCIHRSCIQ